MTIKDFFKKKMVLIPLIGVGVVGVGGVSANVFRHGWNYGAGHVHAKFFANSDKEKEMVRGYANREGRELFTLSTLNPFDSRMPVPYNADVKVNYSERNEVYNRQQLADIRKEGKSNEKAN